MPSETGKKGKADCHIFSEKGRNNYDLIKWDSDKAKKKEGKDD